jgi:hypothetical protein
MRYTTDMSAGFDRIFSSNYEDSPLFAESAAEQTPFWDKYFELQDLATEVAMSDGAFNIEIMNHVTGESVRMENVRLKGFEDVVEN